MFPGLDSDSGSLISMYICSYVHVYACIYAIYACICMYHCCIPMYKSYGLPSAHVWLRNLHRPTRIGMQERSLCRAWVLFLFLPITCKKTARWTVPSLRCLLTTLLGLLAMCIATSFWNGPRKWHESQIQGCTDLIYQDEDNGDEGSQFKYSWRGNEPGFYRESWWQAAHDLLL